MTKTAARWISVRPLSTGEREPLTLCNIFFAANPILIRLQDCLCPVSFVKWNDFYLQNRFSIQRHRLLPPELRLLDPKFDLSDYMEEFDDDYTPSEAGSDGDDEYIDNIAGSGDEEDFADDNDLLLDDGGDHEHEEDDYDATDDDDNNIDDAT